MLKVPLPFFDVLVANVPYNVSADREGVVARDFHGGVAASERVMEGRKVLSAGEGYISSANQFGRA